MYISCNNIYTELHLIGMRKINFIYIVQNISKYSRARYGANESW